MSSFTSRISSKRARGANNGGNQPVCCLVDGCNSDLSNCRDYHRHHKVCEIHSKTSQVSICGLKQRFCQQCSRFHSLEEFDEGKRSCRKRLDGHNRRRRKPQSDLLPRSGGSFFCNQGYKFLSSLAAIYKLTTFPINHRERRSSRYRRPSQPEPTTKFPPKTEHFHRTIDHSSSNNYKAAQPPAFFHDSGGGGGGERNKMVNERYRIGVSESDCALSLLSLPPTHPAVESSAAVVQPLSHHPNDNRGINFAGIFGIDSDNAGNESTSTLPFHWE